MAVLEHPTRVLAPPDERAARRTLRDQIDKLERDLGVALSGAYPRLERPAPVAGCGGPRLLELGELERVRDDLADRVRWAREQVYEQAEHQEARRVLIERMIADPGRFKWVQVRDEDTPSCRTWMVRPRLGLIGMLAGWWHVKLSSGCPLAAAA